MQFDLEAIDVVVIVAALKSLENKKDLSEGQKNYIASVKKKFDDVNILIQKRTRTHVHRGRVVSEVEQKFIYASDVSTENFREKTKTWNDWKKENS